MVGNRVSLLVRSVMPGLLASLLAVSLLLVTSLPVFAGNVRVSDPVQVLSVNQVTAEGSKLPYDLDIYTTNTFTGTSSDFVTRTVAVHLTSPSLIVIAIDTANRFLAIVGGKSVPLTTSQYNNAGSAFKNAASGNHYTDATIAAIQSLESSLHVSSSSTSSSTSSSSVSGGTIVWLLVLVVGVIILVAIFRFIRRLLGFAPPPRRPDPPMPPTNYGDGRDNLGGGTAGSF